MNQQPTEKAVPLLGEGMSREARLTAFAELLVSAWALSTGDKQIPSSHGILDRALQQAIKDNAFEGVSAFVSFADSRVGVRCVELPAVLELAQRLELTASPNPSYQYTSVQITGWLATELVEELGLDVGTVARWGSTLRSAIDEVKKTQDKVLIDDSELAAKPV